MSELLSEWVDLLNGLVWGKILIWLLVGAGLFLTIRLGFIQFCHFFHIFGVLKHSRHADSSGISSYQALCTSLAARVGAGNIAGVAVAITLGGAGAVFWMWVIALVGMATGFAEATLAQLFKTRDDRGFYRGGPAYYMERGLKARWMGLLFSVMLIFAFGLVIVSVQANTISGAMETAFGVPGWISGVVTAVATGLVIFGGLRSIARFSEFVLPFMAGAYLLVAVLVIGMNLEALPGMLLHVVQSAFGLEEAAAGGLGAAILNGFKRGLFSNEAGMGSSPNVAGSATPYPHHPVSQGFVQMGGVFVDTLLLCSVTASIILLSGPQEGQGAELVQNALVSQVGDWGQYFLALIIFFFVFTTIVVCYSYAESGMVYLEHNHPAGLITLKSLLLVMVVYGSVASLPFIWSLADLAVGLMALLNLLALLPMSGLVARLARDYLAQHRAGKVPEFDARRLPELEGRLEESCWERPSPTHS